jgi:hypothetical protein
VVRGRATISYAQSSIATTHDINMTPTSQQSYKRKIVKLVKVGLDGPLKANYSSDLGITSLELAVEPFQQSNLPHD